MKILHPDETALAAFDQPRDKDGKFASTGGGGGASVTMATKPRVSYGAYVDKQIARVPKLKDSPLIKETTRLMRLSKTEFPILYDAGAKAYHQALIGEVQRRGLGGRLAAWKTAW